MKENQSRQDEEFDVNPVLSFIGRGLAGIATSIYAFFFAIWVLFLKTIVIAVNRWKAILVCGLSGALLAAAYFAFKPARYANELVLIPRFSIEDQLINDLSYFQSMVTDKKYDELSQVLRIDESAVKTISKIELETKILETEKIRYFDGFLATVDTTVIAAIDLPELMDNEILEPGYSRYYIKVESTDPLIFTKLEEPLIQMIYRNASAQKQNYQWAENLRNKRRAKATQLAELDSLKKMVEAAMLMRAQSPGQGGSTIIMGSSAQSGNEYLSGLESVYNRHDHYLEELAWLEMQLASESDILKIHAHFTPVGVRSSPNTTLAVILGFLVGVTLLLVFESLRWLYRKGLAL